MKRGITLVGLALAMGGCLQRSGSSPSSSSSSASTTSSSSSSASSSSSGASASGSSASAASSSSSSAGSSSAASSSSSSGTAVSWPACAPRSSSSSSSSGGSSDGGVDGGAGTVAQFFADLGAARCARDQRCAAEQGRQYGSLEACAEADDVISAISVALNGRPLGDLLATAYALADANTRQACLDSVNNTPCSDPVPVGPCELALPPLLAAQEGEACGARTCVAGLYCRSVNNTCAVCTARGNPGDACLTSEHCASNECIATDGGRVCVAAGSQPGPGQRCMSSCRGNLVCVAQGDGGSACTGRAGAGETCSPRNELRPSCVSDLGCLTVDGGAVGTCVGGLTTGSACTRGETQECVCTYATPTAPTGVCNQPPGALDDGEPCGNWLFASFHVCSQDAYPVVFNDGGVTGCVCRARFADCSACTYDDQCATDFCAGPANAMQCRTPAANGLPCNGNVDCASGYCDSVTDTCAPLPACP